MTEPKRDPKSEQPQWKEAHWRAIRTARHVIASDTRAAAPIRLPADLYRLVDEALSSMYVYVPDARKPNSQLMGDWQLQDVRKKDRALKVPHVLLNGVPIAPEETK